METQNITLSLPKELLRKVKMLAVQQDTSVSGLLSKTLQELVEYDDAYERARVRHMDMLRSGFDLETRGSISWKRADLHER